MSSNRDRVTDSKLSNTAGQSTRQEGSEAGAEMRALATAALSKNKTKLSHNSTDASRQTGCGALRTEPTVLNDTYGLI